MAEAIKYGMIKDKALFEQIASRNYNTISDIIDELVYKCIDIKRQVVENDEYVNKWNDAKCCKRTMESKQ